MATKTSKKTAMTDSHKAALAEGRAQSRVIRTYLEALEAQRPRRGRQRTAESIEKRLAVIADELTTATPLARLQMIQERIDLERELATKGETVDLSELEDEFAAVAAAYSDSKGITYGAWRELGIPPELLKRAGIRRSQA